MKLIICREYVRKTDNFLATNFKLASTQRSRHELAPNRGIMIMDKLLRNFREIPPLHLYISISVSPSLYQCCSASGKKMDSRQHWVMKRGGGGGKWRFTSLFLVFWNLHAQFAFLSTSFVQCCKTTRYQDVVCNLIVNGRSRQTYFCFALN